MQVDRFSVAMELDLGATVRDAAQRAGMSVSGWLAQVAVDRLRNDLLGVAVTLGLTRGSRGPRCVSLVLDAVTLLAIDRRNR